MYVMVRMASLRHRCVGIAVHGVGELAARVHQKVLRVPVDHGQTAVSAQFARASVTSISFRRAPHALTSGHAHEVGRRGCWDGRAGVCCPAKRLAE